MFFKCCSDAKINSRQHRPICSSTLEVDRSKSELCVFYIPVSGSGQIPHFRLPESGVRPHPAIPGDMQGSILGGLKSGVRHGPTQSIGLTASDGQTVMTVGRSDGRTGERSGWNSCRRRRRCRACWRVTFYSLQTNNLDHTGQGLNKKNVEEADSIVVVGSLKHRTHCKK